MKGGVSVKKDKIIHTILASIMVISVVADIVIWNKLFCYEQNHDDIL